jgi:hypothetical protein
MQVKCRSMLPAVRLDHCKVAAMKTRLVQSETAYDGISIFDAAFTGQTVHQIELDVLTRWIIDGRNIPDDRAVRHVVDEPREQLSTGTEIDDNSAHIHARGHSSSDAMEGQANKNPPTRTSLK